tara:strand:+ start:117 stop:380 length:264 start_codon:yes stop_codon:yes gene_type:complete
LLNNKNPTIFFVGIILLILGLFIIIFDYNQIQYFENMDPQIYSSIEIKQKEIHSRLLIEFSVGLGILFIGVACCIFFVIKPILERRI